MAGGQLMPEKFLELDRVRLPQKLAADEGVEREGAIVWATPGATRVTVECTVAGSNPEELKSELVDVDISELELIERAPPVQRRPGFRTWLARLGGRPT